jgi:hypothetical protein
MEQPEARADGLRLARSGILVAPGFPLADFDAIADIVAGLDEVPRGHAIRSWLAVAYRHRTCVLESAAFAASLDRLDDHFLYERALFSFITAGLAALESAAFGVHALGYALDPKVFLMTTDEQVKAVGIGQTAARLTQAFPAEPITSDFAQFRIDQTFVLWRDVRNYISHRATPGRNIHVSVGPGSTSITWGGFGEMDPNLTASRLAWLEAWLGRLMADTIGFAAALAT